MSKFKIGDRVLVKNNSHYPKPRRVVKVGQSIWDSNVIVYYLYGVKTSWNKNQYIGFNEEDLIPEEIWNSSLYRTMKEEDE